MLTRLTIRNFKRFEGAEIDLGSPVVFIGPNNSGKTTALQALALWEVGLKRWNEKRGGKKTPEKRPGVTINRRDLIAAPVPDANLLWRNLHVRNVQRRNGKTTTQNICIEILVEGVTEDRPWKCGLEFDYANDESFYCRPMRRSGRREADRMAVPPDAANVRMAFLPPMSGLAANEIRLDTGAINVRVGEGRTAEVLRNLCHRVYEDKKSWNVLKERIAKLFGVNLDDPRYVSERGEIVMSYRENDGVRLDLSSSGRGLQQTLLLLAYMYANPGAALLLDEPDAHLEILRQRQIYQVLTEVAAEKGNQIIAASHSEVLLNEAAGRDVVVAFLGRPHRINDQGGEVLKALREIGSEHYVQAAQTGWVLYLEGSTDLAVLRAFANVLGHDGAREALERPFVHYVGNQPKEARRHFYGLREAMPALKGVALFDRVEPRRGKTPGLKVSMWKRREIENYLCGREVLLAYAVASADPAIHGPLFAPAERERRVRAMKESIREVEQAMETLGHGSPWRPDTKVSDLFLTPLFEKYFKKLGLPNVMAKTNFHELARLISRKQIDKEVGLKLDQIAKVHRSAKAAPMEGGGG